LLVGVGLVAGVRIARGYDDDFHINSVKFFEGIIAQDFGKKSRNREVYQFESALKMAA